jgi:hypothetical protein
VIEFETELPIMVAFFYPIVLILVVLFSGLSIVDVMLFEGIRQETDSKGVRFKNKEPCFIAGFFMSDDFITTLIFHSLISF